MKDIVINGKIIHITKMYDGRLIATAWEKTKLMANDGHSIVSSLNREEGFFGQIGSRRIPAKIEAMKGGSSERIAACNAWRELQRIEAFLLIREAGYEGVEDPTMNEISVKTFRGEKVG